MNNSRKQKHQEEGPIKVKMKAWMIILLVISFAVIVEQSEAAPRKYLNPGVLNPCHGPNPPTGCHPHHSLNKPPVPINTYRRGCSKIHKCKRG